MLAINGGTSARDKKWPGWPEWDENTLKQLESVLHSGRWAISGQWKGTTSKCEQFEQAFAKFNKAPYSITTTNGSSSLVIALEALGVGPGDEVIIPALTWVATAIAVCDVNATPVFVDIDPNTYCISGAEVKKAITSKTKAIIPVHLYGCMVDMDEILKIAKEHDLYVIEDSSHSHGSLWRDQYAGTIGDIGAFSLQQGKVLTSGEGGVILTKDKNYYERCIELRSNSRVYIEEEKLQMDKMQLIEKGSIMGTNYCLSEFQAAVLLDQLQRLEKQNRLKESNAVYLDSQLSQIPGIRIMKRHEQVTKQSYYRYAVRIDNQYFAGSPVDKICKALEAELNCTVEQPYKPLHTSPLYRPLTKKRYAWSDAYVEALSTDGYRLPVSVKAAENEGIVMHHSILLGDRQDMDDIAAAFEKVRRFAHEII
ncbi:MAG: DegT/DnrJ/EryC1/StrS family aminotransferase [Clostridia bacterium]|nr:DegT/DnrJ/EryC1/StrS family aminotransferase [Clostridia bacterium]